VRSLRIIVVLHEPPVRLGPYAAGRWFTVLLSGLVERGHRITAFVPWTRQADRDEAAELFPASDYDLRFFPAGTGGGWAAKWTSGTRPCSYIFGPDLRAALDAELARSFDVLHLETLWSGWMGRRHADRAVLLLHNLYSIDQSLDRPARWLDRMRQRLLWRGERRLIRSYPVQAALTPRLADAARAMNPAAAVHVVPLALDVDAYRYAPKVNAADPPTVGLIGSFHWAPTGLAGERLLGRLWPAIRARVPGARLHLVGRNARKFLARVGAQPGVEAFEDVPDIEPYFRDLDVLLYAPAVGSGAKVKVLEALAFGVPVVTNAEGAEGLPLVDGVHAGMAEDDAGLIERTVALLSNPERRCRQTEVARSLFNKVCDPGRSLDLLEGIYASLCSAAVEPPRAR
jgi:glycosyltransferase involved in cell wall biosynthesis